MPFMALMPSQTSYLYTKLGAVSLRKIPKEPVCQNFDSEGLGRDLSLLLRVLRLAIELLLVHLHLIVRDANGGEILIVKRNERR